MSDVEDPEDEETTTKRLKAALHYTVGKVCESVGAKKNVEFSKEFIGAVAELSFQQTGLFAGSLEDFASHAKRTQIKCDDVKMLARKSVELHKHLCEKEKAIAMEKGVTSATASAPARKKSRKTSDK